MLFVDPDSLKEQSTDYIPGGYIQEDEKKKPQRAPVDIFIDCNAIFQGALTEKKLCMDEGSFNKEKWELWWKGLIVKAVGNDGDILRKWLDHQIEKKEKELSELRRIQTVVTKSQNGEYKEHGKERDE